jgi:hypothetical protein
MRNYAAAGRLRTRRSGGRVTYHAGDVDQLAATLGDDAGAAEQAIVPPGPLLDRIRELERQLVEAAGQVGYLKGLLEETIKDRDQARRQLVDSQARQQRPWIAVRVLAVVALLALGGLLALILLR